MNKYKSKIAGLILISFLTTSALSIFHNHNIELFGPLEIVQHQSEDSSSTDITYNGINFICTVYSNYILLQTTNLQDFSISLINQYSKSEKIKILSEKVLLSHNYLSYNHRAPPIFS